MSGVPEYAEGLTLILLFSKTALSYSPETLPPRKEPPMDTPMLALRCSEEWLFILVVCSSYVPAFGLAS